MSSARISAHKGAVEVPPGTAAAHRGSDAGDPGAGFAAALGALAASFDTSTGHSSHNSDDGLTGDDPAGAQTADVSKAATGKDVGKTGDAIGDADATTLATLPGLGAWFPGSSDGTMLDAPTSSGGHGSRRHGMAPGDAAADIGTGGAAAAAAIAAASLAGSTPQPATPDAATSTGAQAIAGQTVLGAAAPARPGFAGPAANASLIGRSAAAPAGSRPVGDQATAPAGTSATGGLATSSVRMTHPSSAQPAAQPLPDTVGAGPQTPDLAAPDPASPTVAADLPTMAPVQAATNPVPTVHISAATLAAAAPAALAIANPAAPSDSGSGGRDFADSGRDGQAAAAAAFGGIAGAGTPTAAGGGVGASSNGAGAVSGPSFGGDVNVATQLSGQVLRLLQNSGHEAVVRLYPPDLGEVTVRVAVSGRDVTAWFGSSQPAVQQSISAGLGQLQTDLGNAGYSLNNAWVGADASGFGGRGDTPPPPAPIVIPTPAAPATPVAARLSSNAGVSIYV